MYRDKVSYILKHAFPIAKLDPGNLRLQKWYITLSSKDKAKIIKDVVTLALGRQGRMCNFLEYKGAYPLLDYLAIILLWLLHHHYREKSVYSVSLQLQPEQLQVVTDRLSPLRLLVLYL